MRSLLPLRFIPLFSNELTLNKDNKLLYFKQMGEWYVQERMHSEISDGTDGRQQQYSQQGCGRFVLFVRASGIPVTIPTNRASYLQETVRPLTRGNESRFGSLMFFSIKRHRNVLLYNTCSTVTSRRSRDECFYSMVALLETLPLIYI
jgi:hypothetical protein